MKQEMATYELIEGSLPIIVSMPHNGQKIPTEIADTMFDSALEVPDTDWYLDKLYDFVQALDVTVLMPHFSRYVVDLNRSPENIVLYPGQNETEICPLTRFDLEPIYPSEQQPSASEVKRRITKYWEPYHQELTAQIARALENASQCIVFEAHSIKSQVPRFFSGTLPDLNFGTNDGNTCDAELQARLFEQDSGNFSKVLNTRFKGGYITRHYAEPEAGVNCLQLEIAQHTYMDEEKFQFDAKKAVFLQDYLKGLFKIMIDWLGEK